MTSENFDIDTAEIRGRLFWADGKPSEAAGDAIMELCDALDEARLKLARFESLVDEYNDEYACSWSYFAEFMDKACAIVRDEQ
jgi:hypothetical protein